MYNPENNSFKMQNKCTGCNSNHKEYNPPCNKSFINSEAQTDFTNSIIDFPLASVYSPIQNFIEIYDCEKGLSRGTIFAQLDLPFVCGGDRRG